MFREQRSEALKQLTPHDTLKPLIFMYIFLIFTYY